MDPAQALRLLAPALCGSAAPVWVLELPAFPSPRAFGNRLRIAEATAEGFEVAGDYLVLPSTGGGFLLAERRSGRSFARALDLLPLSRPVWKLGRWLLRGAARVGLHRTLPVPRLLLLAPGGRRREGLSLTILSGVPGGCQKFVIREQPLDGSPASFLKAGPSGLPGELLRREAAALRWLNAHHPGSHLGPRLLDSHEEGSPVWIRLEGLSGRRPGLDFSPACARFLAELGALAPQSRPVRESAWLASVEKRLGTLETSSPERVACFRKLLAGILEEAGTEPLPFAPSHGDFTPWNVLLQEDRLQAFDWEYFQPSAPLGSDLFHWLVQGGVLVQRRKPEEILRAIAAAAAAPLRGLPLHLLLRMYLLDAASRDEAVFAHGRPEFVQTRWLWEVRTRLARLARARPEAANG